MAYQYGSGFYEDDFNVDPESAQAQHDLNIGWGHTIPNPYTGNGSDRWIPVDGFNSWDERYRPYVQTGPDGKQYLPTSSYMALNPGINNGDFMTNYGAPLLMAFGGGGFQFMGGPAGAAGTPSLPGGLTEAGMLSEMGSPLYGGLGGAELGGAGALGGGGWTSGYDLAGGGALDASSAVGGAVGPSAAVGTSGGLPGGLTEAGMLSEMGSPLYGGLTTSQLGAANAANAGVFQNLLNGKGLKIGDTTIPNNVLAGGLQAGLGYLGAQNQTNALENIYNQQRADRAPALAAYNNALANPDTWYNSAPAMGATDAVLRRLSVNGNPALNPGDLSKAAAYNMGGYSNYLGSLSGAAFGGQGTQAQLGSDIAQSQGGGLNAIGYGLGTALNPQINLQDILKGMGKLNFGGALV